MKINDLATARQWLNFEGPLAQKAGLIELVTNAGALLSGHFALLSGQHSSHFLRFRAFGRHPDYLRMISEMLFGSMKENKIHANVLLCPESAGSLLGDSLANMIGVPLAIASLDMQRRPTTELAVGKIQRDDQVVLVNDFVTSGSSLDALYRLAISSGAKVTGVVTFATSSSKAFHKWHQQRDMPGLFLMQALWEAVEPAACARCVSGEPTIAAAELN